MGGKGGGEINWASQYDPREGQAYLNRYQDVAASGMDPGRHYYTHGQQEGRYWGLDQPQGGGGGKPYDFFTDAMNKLHQPSSGSSSDNSFEASIKAQEDRLKQQEEERRRIEGENQRNSYYARYMDAAGSATDFVNSEITREQSNARLLGIDYDITDEMKSQRINDYFATIWGEGEQQQLEGLMKEWGNPSGFKGWTVTRGDGSNYEGVEGKEESVGASEGIRPGPAALVGEEEEEPLGGGVSILGA